MALYRTEGPFLRCISLSTSPDRVQAGKTFVVKVYGSLAGPPNQPIGQFLLLILHRCSSWNTTLIFTDFVLILCDLTLRFVLIEMFSLLQITECAF